MSKKLIAFTLIELLVVIAIIGILSGLIVVTMSGVTQKATIAKAQVFSNSLRNALMLNLVSEWKFDELASASNGTVIADSWNGKTGTLVTDNGAAEKISSDCLNGKCISLDGSGDYVNAGSNLDIGHNSFTWSFWAKTAFSSPQIAIHRQASSMTGWNGYFYLPQASNANGLFWVTSSSYSGGSIYRYINPQTNNSNIIDNRWHHFVGVCDRSQHKAPDVYLDGVLANSGSGGYCDNLTDNVPSGILYIGSSVGGVNFKGSIDEVRFYNSAIPSSQIKEQYYAGLNNLLINGSISKEEYLSRINQTAYGE